MCVGLDWSVVSEKVLIVKTVALIHLIVFQRMCKTETSNRYIKVNCSGGGIFSR